MGFQKALKQKVKAKILLYGPSGSGKTVGALQLATGLAKKEGGRIAVIDSESDRANYYADKFDFDKYENFTDFSPDGYIRAIQDAIDGGYAVAVCDTISPEWDWCLDYQQRLGGTFKQWAKVKPLHNKFITFLLQAPIHIIACSRSKEEYVLNPDEKGRMTPTKQGLGLRQSSELDYEFTLCFAVNHDHYAKAEKDNTGLWTNRIEMLKEKDGEDIWNWCNSGIVIPKKPVVEEPTRPAAPDIDSLKQQINAVAREKIGANKDAVMAAVKAHGGNPNAITDINIAVDLLNELQAI